MKKRKKFLTPYCDFEKTTTKFTSWPLKRITPSYNLKLTSKRLRKKNESSHAILEVPVLTQKTVQIS